MDTFYSLNGDNENNKTLFELTTEAATRGFLCKKLFQAISQNSQENTCARVSFLIKLQALGTSVFM